MSKAQQRWKMFLERHTKLEDTLPLVHTTRAYAFDAIIEGDAITPSHCKVFEEELTYLYYGRPAYRARSGANARLEFDWPIAFVLNPEKIPAIKRVFPFDTGAFARGIFREFFDKSTDVMDFDSGESLEAARLIVGAFYSSNHEYYSGSTRHNVDIRMREFEAGGVHELARLPGSPVIGLDGRRDERSSTVELQTSEPVNLLDSVIAIIIPHSYLGDPEILTALTRWNVENIRTYQTLNNTNSDVWVGQIYQIVFQVLEEGGHLTPG